VGGKGFTGRSSAMHCGALPLFCGRNIASFRRLAASCSYNYIEAQDRRDTSFRQVLPNKDCLLAQKSTPLPKCGLRSWRDTGWGHPPRLEAQEMWICGFFNAAPSLEVSDGEPCSSCLLSRWTRLGRLPERLVSAGRCDQKAMDSWSVPRWASCSARNPRQLRPRM